MPLFSSDGVDMVAGKLLPLGPHLVDQTSRSRASTPAALSHHTALFPAGTSERCPQAFPGIMYELLMWLAGWLLVKMHVSYVTQMRGNALGCSIFMPCRLPSFPAARCVCYRALCNTPTSSWRGLASLRGIIFPSMWSAATNHMLHVPSFFVYCPGRAARTYRHHVACPRE